MEAETDQAGSIDLMSREHSVTLIQMSRVAGGLARGHRPSTS